MIKIYLGELDTILMSLKSFINKEIPIKTTYTLSKLLRNLESEYKILIERRNDFINKYAERDDKGKIVLSDYNESGDKQVKIKEGLTEECYKKLDELYSIEVEIDFEPINIELLGDINISLKDLLVLDRFIKNENK
jgi:hypothetical protein